jgi:hypothetical protein
LTRLHCVRWCRFTANHIALNTDRINRSMDATRATRRHLSAHAQQLTALMINGAIAMRTSLVLSIAAAALTAVAIASSGEASATNRKPAKVVRDHRTPAVPVVRDHRTPAVPVVRDHRAPATPVVRDHRTTSKVITHSPAAKKIHRADRNYDKSPNFKQVIVNGKRVPRRVTR